MVAFKPHTPSRCSLKTSKKSKKGRNGQGSQSSASDDHICKGCAVSRIISHWFNESSGPPSEEEVVGVLKVEAMSSIIVCFLSAMGEQVKSPFDPVDARHNCRLDDWNDILVALIHIMCGVMRHNDSTNPVLIRARLEMWNASSLLFKALRHSPYNLHQLPERDTFIETVRYILGSFLQLDKALAKQNSSVDAHLSAFGLLVDVFFKQTVLLCQCGEHLESNANEFTQTAVQLLKGLCSRSARCEAKVVFNSIPSFPLAEVVQYCCEFVDNDVVNMKRRQECAEMLDFMLRCDESQELYEALVKSRAVLRTARLMTQLPVDKVDLRCACGLSTCKKEPGRSQDPLVTLWRNMLSAAIHGGTELIASDIVRSSVIPLLRDWVDTLDEDDLSRSDIVVDIVKDAVDHVERDEDKVSLQSQIYSAFRRSYFEEQIAFNRACSTAQFRLRSGNVFFGTQKGSARWATVMVAHFSSQQVVAGAVLAVSPLLTTQRDVRKKAGKFISRRA